MLVADLTMRSTVTLRSQDGRQGPIDEQVIGCMRRNTIRWKLSGHYAYLFVAAWVRWAFRRPSERYVVEIAVGRPVDPSGYWTTLCRFVGTRDDCASEFAWLTECAANRPDHREILDAAQARWCDARVDTSGV